MKRNIKKSLTHWTRAGLTLIEVVAACAILGLVLTGLLIARARLAHQATLATRKIIAIAWADELMATWVSQNAIPESGLYGESAEHPQLTWIMSEFETSERTVLELDGHRLDIYDEQFVNPVLSLEFVTPVENILASTSPSESRATKPDSRTIPLTPTTP